MQLILAQVETLAPGHRPSFSLKEHILLKLSFPILLLVGNLALPDGFLPHDTGLDAAVWETASLDPSNTGWCLYPELRPRNRARQRESMAGLMLIPIVKRLHSPFVKKCSNLEMAEASSGFSHEMWQQETMHTAG